MVDVSGDASYPVFGIASTFEVKITGNGYPIYPVYATSYQLDVFNSLTGAFQYSPITVSGVGGTIEGNGDLTYPSPAYASEMQAVYEANMLVKLNAYAWTSDADTVKSRRQVMVL